MENENFVLRQGLEKAGLREINVKVAEKELREAESTGGVLLCRKYKEYFQKNKAGDESLQQLDKDLDRQRKELDKKLSQSERRFITIQVVRKDINPYIIPADNASVKPRKRKADRSNITIAENEDLVGGWKCDEGATDTDLILKDIDEENVNPHIVVSDENKKNLSSNYRPQTPANLNVNETEKNTYPPKPEDPTYIDDFIDFEDKDEQLTLPDIHSVKSHNSPVQRQVNAHISHGPSEDEFNSLHLPVIDVTQSCHNIHSSSGNFGEPLEMQLSKSTNDLQICESPLQAIIRENSPLKKEGTRVEFKQLRDRFRDLKASIQEPKDMVVPKLQGFLRKPKLSRPTRKLDKKEAVKRTDTYNEEPTCGHPECRLHHIEDMFKQEEYELKDSVLHNKLVDNLRTQLPKTVASKLEVFRSKLNNGEDYETIRMKRLEKSRKKNARRALDDPRWMNLEEAMKKPPIVLRRKVKVAQPKPEVYDRSKLRFFAAINWMG